MRKLNVKEGGTGSPVQPTLAEPAEASPWALPLLLDGGDFLPTQVRTLIIFPIATRIRSGPTPFTRFPVSIVRCEQIRLSYSMGLIIFSMKDCDYKVRNISL